MEKDVYRGNMTEKVVLKCGNYGSRPIWFNPSNSQYIADELQENWNKYWPGLREALEEMLIDKDTPEWGRAVRLPTTRAPTTVTTTTVTKCS